MLTVGELGESVRTGSPEELQVLGHKLRRQANEESGRLDPQSSADREAREAANLWRVAGGQLLMKADEMLAARSELEFEQHCFANRFDR